MFNEFYESSAINRHSIRKIKLILFLFIGIVTKQPFVFLNFEICNTELKILVCETYYVLRLDYIIM